MKKIKNTEKKIKNKKNVKKTQKEIGGQKGPEPTRYGDWEKKGITYDFQFTYLIYYQLNFEQQLTQLIKHLYF